jgi:UDP-glucuronate 4-epimerase
MKNNRILVTGSSGFIGMHLCLDLLKDGFDVCGIDNMNDYYDQSLKEKRLKKLLKEKKFIFFREDINNLSQLKIIFDNFKPDKVVNLAAQVGVRYSLKNPKAYMDANVSGFMNVLECCRKFHIKGLIYASSSSIYGGNKKIPFSEKDITDTPISIYAATKKSNELMAYSYSHLYNLRTTGLRFFTVYGPWGRPDMAMYIFIKKIFNGEKLSVFNKGNMKRDFTYIDDIVSGIRSSISKNYKCEIFNLGNSKSENLMSVIIDIEKYLGRKAIMDFLPIQPGDVKQTQADISYAIKKLNFSPKTSIDIGILKVVEWYLNYNKITNV